MAGAALGSLLDVPLSAAGSMLVAVAAAGSLASWVFAQKEAGEEGRAALN